MPKRANGPHRQWQINVQPPPKLWFSQILSVAAAGPPFPVFDGVQVPTPTAPPGIAQSTPIPPAPTKNVVPPLGPAERERYKNMFANTGARDGLLDGEQARTIFLRASLPNETLGQIW